MDKEELKSILETGESQTVEFMERFSQKFNIEMVALANAEGGTIFLGVNDQNKISGLGVTNKLKSQVKDSARNCDPPVEIELEEIGNVLAAHVKEGDNKPYRCSEGFYLRQGPNSQKLSRDEILKFGVKSGRIRFDEQIREDFHYPEDFNEKAFHKYLNRAGITSSTAPRKFLKGLNLAEEESEFIANNAAVLFFAKEPSSFIPSNLITCVRFSGNNKATDIIDRKDFDSTLLQNVDDALDFTKRNTRTAAKIVEFERVEKEEYPYEAIREAVLNAVMHRNYYLEDAPTHLNIFSDRIEIVSPGALPDGVTLENLGEISVPRNRLIADLVLRTGLIDKLGTGIKRMRTMMREHGLEEPKFEELDEIFKVTLFGPEDEILDLIPEKGGEDLREKGLNERQIEALRLIVNERKSLTNKDYRQKFDISRQTATRDLTELEEKNFVVGKGKRRSKHYVSK